jgi:predicted TPR repeat methyltransferase
MIALAEQNNPGVQYKLMDAREINTLDSKFDAIICGFCMPYLSKEDCITLILDSSVLLNSGGIFYFSTIEGDYEKSKFESSSDGKHSMFVYYHQEDYLRHSVLDNHFEILQVIRKIYPVNDDTSSTHIIFIANKKV